MLYGIERKKWKSFLCFTDGKQHKEYKLDMISLRNHALRSLIHNMITRDLDCP